jgi:uncharacterized protein (TIGR02996 family)
MATEQSFLDAIGSQPEDRAVRLVYADWLEERGDPRGELIRIEEQMRTLPIYSDRYCELKPRRNALRRECEAKWLRRLKYGTDYEPVFRDVPDGWKERWRLLREFTERWLRIPVGDVGGRQREIQNAERQLKVKLPPAVREWIAYTHDLKEQDAFDDVQRVAYDGAPLDSYEVTKLKDFAAVSLLLMGGGDAMYWAVRKKHLRLPDPPVDWYGLDDERARGGRFVHIRPWPQHVTSFAFEHFFGYIHGAGGGFWVSVEANAKDLQQLAEAFPVHSQFGDLRVFERPNMIARLDANRFGEGSTLHFDVWKKVRRKAVPDFLWEWSRRTGTHHGMFTPER